MVGVPTGVAALRRYGVFIAVGLAAIVQVGAPAAAQGPGQAAVGNQGYVSQSDVSARMGTCALRRNRAGAIAVLNALDAAGHATALTRLRTTMVGCLTSGQYSATVDPIHLEGAMAEQLLAEAGGALFDRARALSPRTPQRVTAGDGAWRRTLACAVAANPSAAVTMLRATAATPAEMAAFRGLAPLLQACAPATGAVTLHPASVRATVAVATYRLATLGPTADPAPAGSGQD